MKIVVVGGTQGVGKEFIQQALAVHPPHHLRILARQPVKLPTEIRSDNNVTVVEGDVRDKGVVEKLVEGADAVVLSLENSAMSSSAISTLSDAFPSYATLLSSMHLASYQLPPTCLASTFSPRNVVWEIAVLFPIFLYAFPSPRQTTPTMNHLMLRRSANCLA
ncbi:hypothetical protein M427DRAFT_291607 [Gonapodya prolifera JEL478]|uniref:NAD(P)-binding domain-containing protein n=1 Tax=Gonapodya prolifera (strain JEL478) TaxID=1344416 RepID=A0A139AIJ2_GONPJ|nr:hypothetical protein M427DRAFT_291607 [Gonapodya prolifera JEL478]|eukprot:KXS16519.1 hypothetical protein M427DRAFT_291607 [Gonapodya prolifera JEL478]